MEVYKCLFFNEHINSVTCLETKYIVNVNTIRDQEVLRTTQGTVMGAINTHTNRVTRSRIYSFMSCESCMYMTMFRGVATD